MVDPVDRERVVRYDRLQGIGDQLQDTFVVQRREEPLVDLDELALTRELLLEFRLAVPDTLEALGVHERLGRVSGEDREDPLIFLPESVAAPFRYLDDAPDAVLVGHRDDEHRHGFQRRPDRDRSGVGDRVTHDDRGVVLGDPASQALADRDAQLVGQGVGHSLERTDERDGLADPGFVVRPVHPDRVVVDELARLGDDCLANAANVLDPIQPVGQVLDRLQACGKGLVRLVQAGVLDCHRHLVGKAAGELEIFGRPVSRGRVVEGEQSKRLGAEDDRDETHHLDPVALVDLAQAGGHATSA
jgi:hypothetical protein